VISSGCLSYITSIQSIQNIITAFRGTNGIQNSTYVGSAVSTEANRSDSRALSLKFLLGAGDELSCPAHGEVRIGMSHEGRPVVGGVV
jgi:hypothetical protein